MKIGDYTENGIYAGRLLKNDGEYDIFVALKNVGEYDWDEAMELDLGKYHLPDIRELSLIELNKKWVNEGLRENNGEEMGDRFFWSSTVYSSLVAWGLGFSSGSRGLLNKNGTLYVRPVLALKIS